MIKEEIYVYNEPLSKHTAFKIGGPAKIWVEPADINELREVLIKGMPYRVIGNGSNILIGDEGVPWVIVKLNRFNHIKSDYNAIIADSGVSLDKLIRFSMEQELSGLEFLAGIPGTVGGAVKTNAGAFGREIAHILDWICVMYKNGRIDRISRDEIKFRYRHSDIRKDAIILEARFRLSFSSYEEIHNDIETALRMRKDRFPVKSPCAGSIFKNPDGASAGELIDILGLKGTVRGRAMVSNKHANIIVNTGGASAEDVKELINYVRDRVYSDTGINLELEIEIW